MHPLTIDEAALKSTIDDIPYDGDAQRTAGKVRENFVYPNGRMAIVVTDRVSVFDYKIGTIPLKGQVLNLLAAWWFHELDVIGIPHHLLAVPHPNVSVVRWATPLPIEIIIRAYLTGTTTTSSWYAYRHHGRTICGLEMPPGMRKNEPFPTAICTPTTKASTGHDANISKAEIIRQGLVSEATFDAAEAYAFKLFAHGQRVAAERGLILVDTKYEMGLTEAGDLILIDEVHTPDSSRYWRAGSYSERLSSNIEPESLDKEFVRRMIINNGYDVDSDIDPKVFLTDKLRIAAAERYLSLFEDMTGETANLRTTGTTDIIATLKGLELKG